MLNRLRQLLESNKAFAASVDESIKTRSARLRDLVDRIEMHVKQKSSAQKFSHVHEFLFISARVYKMCTRSEDDRIRIRASTTSMVQGIPWERLADDQLAISLWSLATVGSVPASLEKIDLVGRQFSGNKSFSNVVWSLARFSDSHGVSVKDQARSLVLKMDSKRILSLSNDEIVSVLRALATIHSQ